MGFTGGSGLNAAQILAAITDDSTKYGGGDINTLTTNAKTYTKRRDYLKAGSPHIWDANADGTISMTLDPIPIMVGTFGIKFTYTTNGNSGDAVGLYAIYEDATHYIKIQTRDSDVTCPQIYWNAGAGDNLIIDGGMTTDTAEHTASFTRDALGNLEVFYDGTTKGTATYNATDIQPNLAYMRLSDSAGNSVVSIAEFYAEGF